MSTSGPVWSVALFGAGAPRTAVLAPDPAVRRDVLRAIAALLAEAGIGIGQVGGFAVDVGPGAFIGLRGGLATVRALAWAHARPVCAVSAIDAYASMARGGSEIGVVIAVAARAASCVVAWVPERGPPQPAETVARAELEGWRARVGTASCRAIAGPGFAADPTLARILGLPAGLPYVGAGGPDAVTVAQIARAAPEQLWAPAQQAAPIYGGSAT